MAQKIQTLFVDDLDGGEAEGTVRFGLDGKDYEIDLSAAHAEALRSALAPYTRAGRKVTGSARRAARNHGKAAANGFSTNEVRDWAKANGVEIKDRGRVPADVIARFRSSTGRLRFLRRRPGGDLPPLIATLNLAGVLTRERFRKWRALMFGCS